MNIPFPNKKYNIIYADPPWSFSSRARQDNSRERYKLSTIYPVLKDKEIKALPVNEIADNDCILFLWTTDAHLPIAIEVLNCWGFHFSTVGFYWLKRYKSGAICSNPGYWTMKNVEQVLIGTKGNMVKYKKTNNIKQFVEAERTVHSKKPDIIRDNIVELFGDLPRIELFARQRSKNWDVWGDQV